jgi:hypothetical protein
MSVWIKISTASLPFDLRRDTHLNYYTESRRHWRKCARTERNGRRGSHEPGPPAAEISERKLKQERRSCLAKSPNQYSGPGDVS